MVQFLQGSSTGSRITFEMCIHWFVLALVSIYLLIAVVKRSSKCFSVICLVFFFKCQRQHGARNVQFSCLFSEWNPAHQYVHCAQRLSLAYFKTEGKTAIYCNNEKIRFLYNKVFSLLSACHEEVGGANCASLSCPI